jgi:uncharacterized protein
MKRLFLALLAVLLLAPAGFALELPPKPTAWVTDHAGVLSSDQQQMLNQKLEDFARRSGSQFLIFIEPTIGDEAIEDYTVRVAEQWKVKQDRALVIFVFIKERKVRIEVGYGLEGAVPDAYAYRVTQEQIAPHFRTGDYAGGLAAGVDTLTARVEGREQPISHEVPQGGEGEQISISPLTLIILVVIFFFVVMPLMRRSGCGCLPFFFPFGGGGGTTFGGGGFGGGGGGGWSVGGGWGGGGGGSFGGGGATGSW